ncbi:MAG: carboxypeptidase regulatory-like domain-containing protein [Nitrospirae bacterium]|nr:MAG: carboxypeptidase regulatory-like domain-containing protein [Nitrospirota bacterium]
MRKLSGIIINIMLISVCMGVIPAQADEVGRLTGRVLTTDGKPLSDGMVFFFRNDTGPAPRPERYWRVPDFINALDGEGRFSVKLPPGSYHIGAIKRKDGRKMVGPPDEGDLFYLSRSVTNEPVTFRVETGRVTDTGDLKGAVPYVRRYEGNITGVSGRVLNENGKPVEGAIVFAYPAPGMIGVPEFVSERTGKDGRYLLRVDRAGSYYLRVRSVYGGGPPMEGEIVGKFGENAPAEVVLKTGRVKEGIDIKVRSFSYSEMMEKRKRIRDIGK